MPLFGAVVRQGRRVRLEYVNLSFFCVSLGYFQTAAGRFQNHVYPDAESGEHVDECVRAEQVVD